MPLEYLSQDSIRINGKILKMHVYDQPFKDGNSHIVEASSDVTNEYEQKLQISELEGLTGGMLPKGFQLIVYRPVARFKNVDFVTFENLFSGPRITVVSGLYYQKWEQRENLIHFGNAFTRKVESTIEKCQACDFSRDEVSITIKCYFSLNENDDCYKEFCKIDEELVALFKKVLRDEDELSELRIVTHDKKAESGGRWWMQNVFVPLLSGGVGAALIGWLISKVGSK